MSNLQYTADILADALFRAGEATDGSSDYASQALIYLNNVYYQICRGGSELDPETNEDWSWLRKSAPGTLILQPPVTTLTATATLGSASVTLSSAPTNYAGSNMSIANWFIQFGVCPDIFKVSAHTSGTTSVTLDSVYTGTTQTLGTCTIFLTDYNLATDVMRIVAPMRVFRTSQLSGRNDYKIYSADLDSIEESYPLALIESGVPDLYALIGETTTGTRRVRFNRCGGPSTAMRVEYEYLFRPTALTSPGTSEEPVLPLQWRHVLSDFTLAFLMGAKNDDRAVAAAGVARAGLLGMATENRYQTLTATRNMFRVKPRGTGHKYLYTESGIRIN